MCKVIFILYRLLIFLNLFIIYLFRQRDCVSWLFFISPNRWIGNEQLWLALWFAKATCQLIVTVFLKSESPLFTSSPAILPTTDFLMTFDLIFNEKVCLASVSATRFVFRFYDDYFSASVSVKMICWITLTEFLFFWITL